MTSDFFIPPTYQAAHRARLSNSSGSTAANHNTRSNHLAGVQHRLDDNMMWLDREGIRGGSVCGSTSANSISMAPSTAGSLRTNQDKSPPPPHTSSPLPSNHYVAPNLGRLNSTSKSVSTKQQHSNSLIIASPEGALDLSLYATSATSDESAATGGAERGGGRLNRTISGSSGNNKKSKQKQQLEQDFVAGNGKDNSFYKSSRKQGKKGRPNPAMAKEEDDQMTLSSLRSTAKISASFSGAQQQNSQSQHAQARGKTSIAGSLIGPSLLYNDANACNPRGDMMFYQMMGGVDNSGVPHQMFSFQAHHEREWRRGASVGGGDSSEVGGVNRDGVDDGTEQIAGGNGREEGSVLPADGIENNNNSNIRRNNSQRRSRRKILFSRPRNNGRLQRFIEILEDRRIKEESELYQLQDMQRPRLRNCLNIVFVTAGILFLLGVLFVIIYTAFAPEPTTSSSAAASSQNSASASSSPTPHSDISGLRFI